MNLPCPIEDNDFPVFKAGPPLPIRAKGKPHVKTKGGGGNTAPLKATSPSVIGNHGTTTPKQSSSSSNAKINHSPSFNAESKVKQYIERVKASDELGRKKRLKPEQMLSLEELYQVNLNEDSSPPGKNENQLEEQISVTEVQEKLRETMRIVKEKDELINKLRESCHDLAIKCADAENRVDELRFSYGKSVTSPGDGDSQPRSLSILGRSRMSISGEPNPSEGQVPRRCASMDGIFQEKGAKADKAIEVKGSVEKQDAHTQVEPGLCANETLSEKEVGHWEEEDDILQETCSNWLEKVQNWKTDSNFNLSQDSGGDRDSGFRGSAEIDNESILRRQQQRLLSSRSRRRSEEKAGERSLKVPTTGCGCNNNSNNSNNNNNSAQIPKMSASSTTTITASQQHASLNSTTSTSTPASRVHPVAEEEDQHHHNSRRTSLPHQHFWPSFSTSQSYFHLNHLPSENLPHDSIKAKSLFYELAEAERNKYSFFQENRGFEFSRESSQHSNSQRHHHHLHGAKSLDVLYFPQTAHHRTKEELRSLIDSSFDPPEFILKSHLSSQHRSIDKKVKLLDPLLDDATQIALRVRQKSERLAKMLQDACMFD